MILNFHQWCKLDQYVRARESGGIRQCRTPTHRGSVRARARGNPNLIEQNLVAQIEPLKFEYRNQWFDYYELPNLGNKKPA